MTLQKISIAGLILCSLVLAGAYYLEYQYMLAVCPLCILQRIVFGALAVVFLIGTLLKIKGTLSYIYSGLIILLSICGLALAGRQLWLQYFAPPLTISCSASLTRLLDLYPALEALKRAITGSGECATIDLTILGLSIAAWSLAIFGAICVIMFYVVWLQKKRRI